MRAPPQRRSCVPRAGVLVSTNMHAGDPETIVKILDLCPDAEVVIRPDGTLHVRRGPKRGPSGTFNVAPDGSLHPARPSKPPPLPAGARGWEGEQTPVVSTGVVNG